MPFTAGDHRYRVVIRQDSVLWSTRLLATNAVDATVALASPGWELTQIDSVGVRAQASDVAAWVDNFRVRAITSLSTTATLVGTSSVNIDGTWTEFPLSGNYRYVRVYLIASGTPNHGFDLAEFAVYGVVP